MLVDKIKTYVKKNLLLKRFLINPFVFIAGWFYGIFLTILYVDKYKHFPAIIFSRGLIRLKIEKKYGGKLIRDGRLVINPNGITRNASGISIGNNGILHVKNEFVIGDEVVLNVCDNATLDIGGLNEEYSGITGKALINAYQYIQIGYDVIIAWDVFITDCDWHQIGDTKAYEKTIIGNHVWIAHGVSILKGVNIGDNCIIAAKSVVTKKEYPVFSLIGGIPAKVLKNPISTWTRDIQK